MTNVRGVVLVEGVSDQMALETLAQRLGRDLEAECVSVVPMGGASAFGEFMTRLLASQGFDGRVAGLCDEGELGELRQGLERAGLGINLTRSEMEALGFHVCVVDLEDELVRALGVASAESVIESQGELGAFRTFQKQPAWRERSGEDQVRRFIGSKAGRKARYGRLLVDALDLAAIPRPLQQVLAHIRGWHDPQS